MFDFKKNETEKQEKIDRQREKLNEKYKDMQLSASLDESIKTIKELFKDNDTLVLREFQNNHHPAQRFCIAFSDGVVNSTIINEHIIRPIMLSKERLPENNPADALMNQIVLVNDVKKAKDIQNIIESVTYGDTLLLTDGDAQALLLNSKGFQMRGITEPEAEKVLSGPREGFCEGIMTNLSLVRRKLRTNDLKMKFLSMGERTNTQICVCYLDSIVNKKILEELFKRLDTIKMDGILDANYINENINDAKFSLFRTIGYTERPDVVAAKLLEGRISVFIDGTPQVMTVPYLFIENFQSNEDYYLSFYYSTFTRLLRILAFFLAITIPAIYISVVAFHQEILPTSLIVSVASAQKSVPLPVALEAFLMLLVFDLLKETGIRMPSSIGQALSIVGALVIGQAAVEAKLVSAPMVIVIAFTGITGLLVPKLVDSVMFYGFFLLFMASVLGIFGVAIGFFAMVIHLLNLHSFGIPQIVSVDSLQFQEVKDTLIRAPWPKMIKRPRFLTNNRTRMKPTE